MTRDDICNLYIQAKDKKQEIIILSELTLKQPLEIIQILRDMSFVIPKEYDADPMFSNITYIERAQRRMFKKSPILRASLYHKYTPDEDERIVSLKERGATFGDIGEVLSLTYDMVRNRYKTLKKRGLINA